MLSNQLDEAAAACTHNCKVLIRLDHARYVETDAAILEPEQIGSEQSDLGASHSNAQVSRSVKCKRKNRLFLGFSITSFCQQQDTVVHRMQNFLLLPTVLNLNP